MSEIVIDIEDFHKFFFVGMKRREDGKRVGIEMSWRKPDADREFVRRILLRHTTYSYNGLAYDLPMLWYWIDKEATCEQLKRASDMIIKGRLKPWEIEDALGIRIPYDVKKNHIDLMGPQPNASASLKILNGRTHLQVIQDLPFDPDEELDDEKADLLIEYNMGPDLDGPDKLIDVLAEPLELRRALGPYYGKNFMCKSDAQIGEQIIKSRVEHLTGNKVQGADVRPGTSFRYPVPAFLKFETPELKDILERLRETDFFINGDGKVDTPPWLAKAKCTIGETTYKIGIGGLHSTESNRALESNETHVLVDGDAASQYPVIILMLGLYPKALGPQFLDVYREILAERLKAKKRSKAIKIELEKVDEPDQRVYLEAELETCKVKDKGFKIALNGSYGKLGSRYSVLYAPHLMISVTLTGQLTLLMLIERAEKAGIQVVSGNTDGVMFYCPHEHYAGLNGDRLKPSTLATITSQWEKEIGFDLEFGEYKAIYNQSVNSYFAIKADGGHKRKGPLGNPWNPHPDDFDPVRGQLMKNPQATICSDAALMRIKENIPIEETIRGCRDIRQFVTVIKASKGATWRGGYLGKVVRYYWGVNGEPIYRADPHPTTGNFAKVPKTDGAIECMRLPDEFPDDIDYARYISEADEILRTLGFYGAKVEPRKPIRLTKANREAVLRAWLLAA